MYEGKHFNERVRQIGFLLGLVFLACLIVSELRFFASSMLGGFTIFMILRKPHAYLQRKGWSNALATAFLMIVTLIVLGAIVGGLLTLLYSKIKTFGPNTVMTSLHDLRNTIIRRWDYDIFSADLMQQALSSVGNVLSSILSLTGSVLANTIMMLFVLVFLLGQRTQFEQMLEAYIPISPKNIQPLKSSVHSMVMMNAVGIPLILLVQAIVSGFAYWILNAGDPVIWGLLTGLFGLVPVVGTASIWIPLSIELLVEGHTWQGIVLLIYGVCIISIIDYGARMIFMKKKANVHPLVTVFGIILGMKLFGFWGIIFGPLMISGLFLLIEIYSKEFRVEKPSDDS